MGTLDENIKSLCTENGVTFTQMCGDLGLSRNLLTELRKGRKKSITGTTAQKIADYFGVTVDRVLYGKREDPEKSVETGDDLAEYLEVLRERPDMRVLFSVSKGATPEEVAQFVKVISALRGDK